MADVVVCATDEISSGAAKRFDVDGHRIAVARIGDTFYAIGDRCSHEDFSLSLGEVDVENCEIECARHGASFALATGEAMTFPATAPVTTYAVSTIDGAVVVTIP